VAAVERTTTWRSGPTSGNLRVGEDVVVAIPGAQASAGQKQVGSPHRIGQIEDAETARAQALRLAMTSISRTLPPPTEALATP
jgi:hypothetical protein